ncbi:MAG: DUF4258 domain-containing protein [Rhodothermales bacterium]
MEDVYEGPAPARSWRTTQRPRGLCCLVNGKTRRGRPIHVVCTTARTPLFVVTVYEPKPPKFITPSQRGRR